MVLQKWPLLLFPFSLILEMPVHLSVRAFFAILLFLLLINEEW